MDIFEESGKDLNAWFDSLFESIAGQLHEVLSTDLNAAYDLNELGGLTDVKEGLDGMHELLMGPLPDVKLVKFEGDWHITLLKGEEKFFYTCAVGDEASLIKTLMAQADDSEMDFGWIDAAAICRKIGEMTKDPFESDDDSMNIELDDNWDLFGDQAA